MRNSKEREGSAAVRTAIWTMVTNNPEQTTGVGELLIFLVLNHSLMQPFLQYIPAVST